jgi:ATP-dependent RNA helicase DHX36
VAGTNAELVTGLLVHLVKTQPEGAVLVFLPGWDDIMTVLDLLSSRLRNEIQRYLILPLHSMLSSRDQHAVFNVPPKGVRKVILATNIAESSVTIDDIVYVVNTGTVKVKTFDTTKKITHLSTQWSSKASVIQRRGRAGRCQPGHAYNLFTKEQFACMDEYQVPEMQRTPLEDLVLQAKLLNPWNKVALFLSQALTPPRHSAISSAVNVLKDLGALDSEEALTPMGKALAELPIEPMIGRLVLLGTVLGAVDPILTIAASMGYRDPFVNPPTKRQQADEVRSTMAAGCCSDHLLTTRAYNAWQLARKNGTEAAFVRESFLHRGTLTMMEGLRKQFRIHLEELGLKEFDQYNELSSSEPMVRAILTAGLQPNVMKMAKMLESGGHRPNSSNLRKRVRSGFKTM